MKKITTIIFIILGMVLIVGSMFSYYYLTNGEADFINLLGFSFTSPTGILGIILIAVGLYKMFTIKK